MELLNTKIYIFIDDLDRILDEESRINILKVIYEAINLKNCLTIFTIDQDKFLGNEDNKNSRLEYINKYIDFSFRLNNISFEEILDNYKNLYFSKDFITGLNPILNDKNILEKIKKIYKNIEESLDTNNNTRNNNMLKKFKNNPRKVKHLLNLIENMIDIINNSWFIDRHYINNEYTHMDWIDAIVRVAILNIYYTDYFDYLYSLNNINNYNKDIIKEDFFNIILIGTNNTYENKNIELYNLLICNFYTMNAQKDKTKHQKIIDELENNNINLKHIKEYIFYCFSLEINYEQIHKILLHIENNSTNTIHLDIIIDQYMKICHAIFFLEHPDCIKISKSLCHAIIALEKKGILSTYDINEYIIYIENMFQDYFSRRLNMLNDLVNYLQISDQNIFSLKDISQKLLNIKKINYNRSGVLLNWIHRVRDTICNIDENDIILKSDFYYTTIILERMISIIIEWNKILLNFKTSKNVVVFSSNKDLISIIDFCEKIMNLVSNNNVCENDLNKYISFFESINYNKFSDRQKIKLKKYIFQVYLSLEKQNIFELIDRQKWYEHKKKIQNSLSSNKL